MSARIRIIHPFHPLRGKEFPLVAECSSRHGDRVWYERGDGAVATIARSWTNLAAADPFATLSGGKAHFRPEGLAELAELVATLTDRGSPPGGHDGV